MKIVTKQFGELEFEEKNIIQFREGLIGFEQLKKFVLLTEENGMFYWLTSINEPEIIFPLIPVTLLREDYPVTESHQGFAIVKLNREPTKITANLKAPVYINQETSSGFQKIIDKEDCPINYQLFVEKED